MNKDINCYSTRYIGSKVKLLPWIWAECEPVFKDLNVHTVFDAFAGTGVVGYMFKQKGFKIMSNDFLDFNYYLNKGLVENNGTTLSPEEIEFLLNPPVANEHFIEEEYTDLFFPLEDTQFLDNVYFAIQSLEDDYKKAIAMASATQAILKKAPYGRFTTTKMTNIGVKTIREYFKNSLLEFNSCVSDNGQENIAFLGDTVSLLPSISPDAVYFDPPYGGKSFSKYEHFYNFLEIFTNYMKDEPKVGKLKQVKNKNSDFSYGKKHLECFNSMLVNSTHIPLWVFSYNNNGGLDIDTLTNIIKQYKPNVVVKETPYEYANKVSKYIEYLIFAY